MRTKLFLTAIITLLACCKPTFHANGIYPRWLNGEKSINTSIGIISWFRFSYLDGIQDEPNHCVLVNGNPTLGRDDVSCENVEISILDFDNSIIIVSSSYTSPSKALPFYKIIHLNNYGSPTSVIEFSAPHDEYELAWTKENNEYVSKSFEADGKHLQAKLTGSGVQLITENISKNQPAPGELCKNMQESLSTVCATSSDCNNIESNLSNVDFSWFYAAKTDPRFDYDKFVIICKSICDRKNIEIKNFSKEYCNASD
jgi:hypothetical protein